MGGIREGVLPRLLDCNYASFLHALVPEKRGYNWLRFVHIILDDLELIYWRRGGYYANRRYILKLRGRGLPLALGASYQCGMYLR